MYNKKLFLITAFTFLLTGCWDSSPKEMPKVSSPKCAGLSKEELMQPMKDANDCPRKGKYVPSEPMEW